MGRAENGRGNSVQPQTEDTATMIPHTMLKGPISQAKGQKAEIIRKTCERTERG